MIDIFNFKNNNYDFFNKLIFVLKLKTGLGQQIECNLLSTQLSCLVNLASNYLNAGIEAQRLGTAHESIVPYQSFQTKDERWLTIGTGKLE